jgi:hypothetical protein
MSTGAAKRGTDRSEFALQHVREIRDHKNQGANDQSEQYNVLSHCRTVFVFANAFEQLNDLGHEDPPTFMDPIYGALTFLRTQ